ncbi:MAG: DUF971 domain-containing protein [Myxococcota bacterium]|nr:DUF971 domain-containing protein [Myxococcota bacterium]
MTDADRTRPIEIRQAGPQVLEILWADQGESRYPVRDLRLACNCAICVDEWTGEHKLDPAEVAVDIHPVRVKTVGRYALNIIWSDGHESGIYPFERLRDLGDRIRDGSAKVQRHD